MGLDENIRNIFWLLNSRSCSAILFNCPVGHHSMLVSFNLIGKLLGPVSPLKEEEAGNFCQKTFFSLSSFLVGSSAVVKLIIFIM